MYIFTYVFVLKYIFRPPFPTKNFSPQPLGYYYGCLEEIATLAIRPPVVTNANLLFLFT